MAKWLNTTEVKTVRKNCKEKAELDKANGRFTWQKYRAIVEFLLGTGLRASEALDTKIKDLYLNGKKSVDDYLKVRTLKRRKKVEDVVMINKELAKVLKDYLQELKLFKPSITEDDYLFPGRGGKKQKDILSTSGEEAGIQWGRSCPLSWCYHFSRESHGKC